MKYLYLVGTTRKNKSTKFSVDKNKTTFYRKPVAAFGEHGIINAVCIYKNTVVAISDNYQLISYTKGTTNPAVQVLIIDDILYC